MDKMNVAVIGCGYWGPNIIRNFSQLSNCQVKYCCDLDFQKLGRVKKLYPSIETTSTLDTILQDDAIEAVAIVTPISTHYEIARQCLEHKKHVLIEKPITASAEQALSLIRLSEKNNRVLMVGHTFEYTAAVNKVKEAVESGELGDICYICSERLNLGLFQPDYNVIWDLAPHDISIILYVMNDYPVSVNAQGKAHYKKDIEDVAVVTLNFSNGGVAFLHVSWLDPCKVRRTTFVGTKKMLVYDDINTNEKIKVYDKGVEAPPYYDTYAEFHFSYRYGDIHTPRINEYEPLRQECEHFLDCITNHKIPQSDGYSGLRNVSILEAANQSLRNKGAEVALDSDFRNFKRMVA